MVRVTGTGACAVGGAWWECGRGAGRWERAGAQAGWGRRGTRPEAEEQLQGEGRGFLGEVSPSTSGGAPPGPSHPLCPIPMASVGTPDHRPLPAELGLPGDGMGRAAPCA